MLRVVLAGLRSGSAVYLSTSEALPDAVSQILSTAHGERPALAGYHVESELQFVERERLAPPERIRLLGGNASVIYVHFDGNPAVAVWDHEVTESGRVEMLPFVREQAVSVTAHRFGAPDPRFLSLQV